MKRQKRNATIVISLVLILMTALSACGGTQTSQTSQASAEGTQASTEEKKILIGFSNGFSGNVWRTLMMESFKQELEKHPDVEAVFVDGQNDINKQVNDIQSLIAQNVDGIMTIPLSAQALEPVLAEARKKGIKVVSFNQPLSNKDSYDVFVGTNPLEKGRAWGKWLVEKLGGKGNVIMLGGTPGNPFTAAVKTGAEESFAGTDVKIIVSKDVNYSEETAKMIMSDLLTSTPDFDAILCDAGPNACGALKAMLDAKKPLVPVTGNDYNGLLKLYVSNKASNPDFDVAIYSEPTWESREALKCLINLINGQKIEQDSYVEMELITGDAAAALARPNLPDTLYVDTDLPEDVLSKIVK